VLRCWWCAGEDSFTTGYRLRSVQTTTVYFSNVFCDSSADTVAYDEYVMYVNVMNVLLITASRAALLLAALMLK